jgi:hypothetical protein
MAGAINGVFMDDFGGEGTCGNDSTGGIDGGHLAMRLEGGVLESSSAAPPLS